MSVETHSNDKHQQTGEMVKLVRERNRVVLQRADRREARMHDAERRSASVVRSALERLRASGVIR